MNAAKTTERRAKGAKELIQKSARTGEDVMVDFCPRLARGLLFYCKTYKRDESMRPVMFWGDGWCVMLR